MRKSGFTLAELLIALAILGVIATFTIPKVLNSSQNSEWNAIAKETVSMISGAYSSYKLNNTVSSVTNQNDLTPFMNFVRVDTISVIDSSEGLDTLNCGGTATRLCLVLHNGSYLRFNTQQAMGGTNTTNALRFWLDPDGVYSGSINGAGKSLEIYLYYNGRITTRANIETNTCDALNCYNPNINREPVWFSWN